MTAPQFVTKKNKAFRAALEVMQTLNKDPSAYPSMQWSDADRRYNLSLGQVKAWLVIWACGNAMLGINGDVLLLEA